MTSTAAPPEPDTLADVLRALGDIPLDRILWNPRPGTATEADVVRYAGREPRRLVELIDGVLVEKPMGARESYLAFALGGLLYLYNQSRNLGVYGIPDAIMRMRAGRVRLPDLHFTSWALLPDDHAHLLPVVDYPPELAIEVLSESNTRGEMLEKRRDYFAAGSRLVWEFDPRGRTVAVYTDPTTHTTLTVADTLTGGDVLPGFVLRLADFFAEPQLNPRPADKRP